MAKKPTTLPAVKEAAGLPTFMQGGKKSSIGNIDASDLIIPRLKLIQKISPETETYNEAVPGEFWHTIAEQSLGSELRIVPILCNKSVILWAPRGDERRILARSNDCIHWNTGGNESFDVKPKNATKQTWDTKGSVAESGLTEFGSSIDGDSNSTPAASLTYNLMLYLIDRPDISPIMVINTRSSIKPGKDFLTKINMRDGKHYGQIFTMSAFLDGDSDEQFYNYRYSANGYVQDEELYKRLGEMSENFRSTTNWRVNEESEDEAPEKTPKGDASGRKGKF